MPMCRYTESNDVQMQFFYHIIKFLYVLIPVFYLYRTSSSYTSTVLSTYEYVLIKVPVRTLELKYIRRYR